MRKNQHLYLCFESTVTNTIQACTCKFLFVCASTYLDRKYYSWDGAEETIPVANHKANDCKDNGQDQEIIADRSGGCINHIGRLYNNYIPGLKKLLSKESE